MALLGTREVNGVELELHANVQGTFWLREPDGEEMGRGDTLDQAVQQARTEINRRKVKVEVPFVTLKGERGIATGRHGGHGKVLARVNGKATTLDTYAAVLRGDTPPEVVAEIKRHQQAMAAARAAEFKLRQQWEIRLGHAVDKAIEEALR